MIHFHVYVPPAFDVHQPHVSSPLLHDSSESDDLRKENENVKNKVFQVFVALEPKSKEAAEEPRPLCNRKEFYCLQSERENRPMQLQRTKVKC